MTSKLLLISEFNIYPNNGENNAERLNLSDHFLKCYYSQLRTGYGHSFFKWSRFWHFLCYCVRFISPCLDCQTNQVRRQCLTEAKHVARFHRKVIQNCSNTCISHACNPAPPGNRNCHFSVKAKHMHISHIFRKNIYRQNIF